MGIDLTDKTDFTTHLLDFNEMFHRMLYDETKVQRDANGSVIPTKVVTSFILENAPVDLSAIIKARPFRALQPLVEEQKRNKLVAFPDVLDMNTAWGDKFKLSFFDEKTKKTVLKEVTPFEDWPQYFEKEVKIRSFDDAFGSPTASPMKKVRPL